MTAQTIISEIGLDVVRFPYESLFACWLGPCPEQEVSGGKVLYTRTGKVKNRLPLVVQLGGQELSATDTTRVSARCRK